jgi:hypothetical protein
MMTAALSISTDSVTGTDDNCFDNIGFFDTHVGNSVFNDGDNAIANEAITAVTFTQYADAHEFAGTAIICDIEISLLLNHDYSP